MKYNYKLLLDPCNSNIHIQNIHLVAKYCHLGKYYGGLPPEGPTFNPRKGSCTGSYALPVPPEWLRSQKYEGNRKRGSGNKQYIMDGSFSKSRSGSIEMLPGWLGSVLSGTLVGNPMYTSTANGRPLLQKEAPDENNPKTSVTQDYLEKDLLPEVIVQLILTILHFVFQHKNMAKKRNKFLNF